MKHITVLSNTSPSIKKIDYTQMIAKQSYAVLTSLIDAFNNKNFGFDTTFKTAFDIKKFKELYMQPIGKQLYIDSSGYSIIKGFVATWDTQKVIDCYHEYLSNERQVFDNIFSLDIPFNSQCEKFNHYKIIEHFNRESLSKSKELLEEDPALADKFYFIYQFKEEALYQIWDSLYNELELGKIVKNWSLGGMVSLKSRAKIDFSPFIGMSFRTFFDFLNNPNRNSIFKLHFLGIHQRPDRFHIAFIEKLIQSYLNGNAETLFTYDSINYIRQAQMVKELPIFDFSDNELNQYSLNEIPGILIKEIYNDENNFYEEIERRNIGKDLANINAFAPLSIYSNVKIDQLFEYVIEAYDMINIFKKSISIDHVDIQFKQIFKKISKRYPLIFKRSLITESIKNLRITFAFHKWYRDKQDKKSLDKLILSFINLIKPEGESLIKKDDYDYQQFLK